MAVRYARILRPVSGLAEGGVVRVVDTLPPDHLFAPDSADGRDKDGHYWAIRESDGYPIYCIGEPGWAFEWVDAPRRASFGDWMVGVDWSAVGEASAWAAVLLLVTLAGGITVAWLLLT